MPAGANEPSSAEMPASTVQHNSITCTTFRFAIGNLESLDTSWMSVYHYDKEVWFIKHCVSLRWSLTHFTPASKVSVTRTSFWLALGNLE